MKRNAIFYHGLLVCLAFWLVPNFCPGEDLAGSLPPGATGAVSVLTSIRLGDRVDQTMEFAAAELAGYFQAMTGRNFPIQRGMHSRESNEVYLGIDPRLQQDGYRIYCDGNSVCVSGGSSRGCLYGAYMFLNELGCRFPLPGRANEWIPSRKEISWSGLPIKSEPAVASRGIMTAIYTWSDDILVMIDFLAKNRFNFILLHVGPVSDEYVPKLKEALEKRDMGFEWGGHFLPGFLPRELIKEHPDYFRMEKGQRTEKLNMCPSSEAAADLIAKNSLSNWDRLRGIRRFEMLHIWPDDLEQGGWCTCDACKGLSDSDQALKIINEVARRLPLGEETAIAHASYHATIPCPTTIRPYDNVKLLYAPRERCYRHAMNECPTNQRYYQWLKNQIAWFANDPEVVEYYLDPVLFRQLPMPLHPVIGRDVEVYRSLGIERIAPLSFQIYSDWAYGPNYYVFGKSVWRGRADPGDIREYCQAMYGPFAEEMERYFDELFVFCATAMQTCGYEGFADMRWPPLQAFTKEHVSQLAPLITDLHMDQMEGILSKALAEAKEPWRTRIDQQLTLWKMARLEVPAIYYTLLAKYKFQDRVPETEADRLFARAIIQKAISNIDQVRKLLLSTPAELHGPHIFEGGGMIQERAAYPNSVTEILKKLEPEKPVNESK